MIYVDSLQGDGSVGQASVILSYCWRHPFQLVSGALADWCSTDGPDQRRVYVWIDVVCWNQNARLGDPTGDWERRVLKIGHQLTMLHPWSAPIYTTRAW